MLNWIIPASDELNMFIECYWFIEKTVISDHDNFPKLNPDPSAHLILSPALDKYSYTHEQQVYSGIGSHLLNPHQHTFELDHSKPFTHIGIKFRPGALYSFSRITSAITSINVVEPLELTKLITIDQALISHLFELARKQPIHCIKKLEHYLQAWIKDVRDDQHSQLVRRIFTELETTPISELAVKLHCSQRTIERSFRRVTHLTLKQYQAMAKLEAMLEHLYQRKSSDINWADLAVQFGFSDQPHLIRYLKKQIDLTPQKYALKRGLTIDIYGGVKT